MSDWLLILALYILWGWILFLGEHPTVGELARCGLLWPLMAAFKLGCWMAGK